MRKYKSAVVRVVHEHSLMYGGIEFEIECRCGEFFNHYSVHADHVASKILDAFDEIERETND